MTEYPLKILVAFGEAVDGNIQIHRWLLNNGYPELAALISSLNGSREAEDWLQNNKFQHLLAFHYAVYDDDEARKWLGVYKFNTLARLADATNGYKPAMEYFRKKELSIFIRLAFKIKQLKDQALFDKNDYHKMKF
ncbi:MAG: hypothetical protein ACOCPM_02610 [Bacteroidales bacterium]